MTREAATGRSEGEPMAESARIRRAVYITTTEPEPRSYGKRVVMGGILDYLCDTLGGENVHLILIAKPDVELRPTRYRIHLLPKPRSSEQAWSLVSRVAAGPHTSIQEAAVYAPRIAREIRELLATIDADLEVWDTIRTGQYAAGVPRRRRLLYEDDLFSERYKTMLRELSGRSNKQVNPLGEFHKMLPRPARPLLSRRAVYRPLLRLESRLVGASERNQPGWFDATLLVNDEETNRLRTFTGRTDIHTLLPMLPEVAPRDRAPVGARFAFLGGLDYAPNTDGLTWFLTHCREQVLAALPNFELLVIGKGTEVGVPEAAAWGEHVKFVGWVDDLGETLAGCSALLSVLRVGSGIKIKVLEALSRSLPVVATPYGVQGTEVGEENGCLIGSTPADLAALLARAADPDTNQTLSAAARETWEKRFAPDVIRRSYDEFFS
ncbi:glycosyltransferase [Cryptosporangium aurantiacum]|uniref:Glycosyl transferases group 1 n=1 Tax=Cryptosporangium aurantiacum TaxID=134849 RepID=A0A1M7RDA7_9ACTN|nr:glycosyltransferase family 4 protein [Cryptosporangium aurantiacum]SHN44206.1 Glycosyl transferases group 1 [Cryptosporangium aurantiacum]